MELRNGLFAGLHALTGIRWRIIDPDPIVLYRHSKHEVVNKYFKSSGDQMQSATWELKSQNAAMTCSPLGELCQPWIGRSVSE